MDNLNKSLRGKNFKSWSIFSQGAGVGIGIGVSTGVGGKPHKPTTGDCFNLAISYYSFKNINISDWVIVILIDNNNKYNEKLLTVLSVMSWCFYH